MTMIQRSSSHTRHRSLSRKPEFDRAMDDDDRDNHPASFAKAPVCSVFDVENNKARPYVAQPATSNNT